MTLRVAVTGATGKMGQFALRLIDEASDLELHAALNSSSSLDALLGADVIFDVTRLEASEAIVEFAVANDLPIVVGTSGWSAERIARIETFRDGNTSRSAVVVVPNFSLGSVLGSALSAVAARYFSSIEIVETHGATKIDSPSGTAVRTAELIAAARATAGLAPVEPPHADQVARGQVVGGVPVHSLRLQGVAAEQRVTFGAPGETLRIEHVTVSQAAYEPGILHALRFAVASTGTTVGLDRVIGLDFAAASAPTA
ncbi:MAG TPA: 4-hydroxy-tetrahydrodipicolinate reductase [Candidatus Lumbricidophila sp.]|nr:4-hydroxy-tetrahydrodipicolinate reductase [Candidatus Lumbricidophila sp.]